MPLTSSANLMATAADAATAAATAIAVTYNTAPADPLTELRYAEAKLTQALAELRAAQWGIRRRMPQFDAADLELLLEHEIVAIRGAHDLIPPAR